MQCGQSEGWTGGVSVCGVARVKVGLVVSVCSEGWTGVSICSVARVKVGLVSVFAVKVGLVLSVFAVWPG